MAAKVLALINFKGGVGKTAATVNLGASLSHYFDKKVLIVDLDPQCNSSFWLMHPNAWKAHVQNGKNSTYQIFLDHIQGSHTFQFDQAVVRGVPRKDYPLIAKLDLLPGAIELLTIEDRIYQNKYARFFEYLSKSLAPVFSGYDYVLLDCPPNTYAVTKNALFASDYCIVPYVPDFLSLSGFQILARQISEYNLRVQSFRLRRGQAHIGAVMVSHFQAHRRVADDAVQELQNILAELKSQELVHAQAALLSPYIRLCTHVAASSGEHLPVCLHDPNSIGAADYYNLAYSLDQHFAQMP